MTELTCWPLDNKKYYSDAMGAAYAARSRGLLHSTDFSATANGDNSITLTKGVACIHVDEFWAAFPYSKNDIILQFEDADGVYPRWDVAVIGYDKNGNVAGAYTRSGIPAQEPVYPEIRKDDEFDEIFLYAVKRPVGATQIRAEDIVDLRINQDYCGLMRDTIDAIDTKVMQAAFESFLDKIEAELERLNAGTEAMMKTEYDPEGRGENIFSLTDRALVGITVELPASGWTGEEAPYSQTVTVEGMTADRVFTAPTSGDNSKGMVAVSEALGLLCGAESAEGSVTLYATDKPEIDLTVVLRG